MEKSEVIKTNQSAAAATNMMDRLPKEIIIGILSRLPITSLARSMMVCRAWRSFIKDPLLISEHFSRMADIDNDPSFILQSGWSNPHQLYFTDFSGHSRGMVITKKPPNSDATHLLLVDSCNGLLCLRDSESMYICNPFTRQCLELPKFITNHPARLGNLEFGFHPTTKEYKVVMCQKQFAKGDADANTLVQHSEVNVLTIGSPVWRNTAMICHSFVRQTSKVMINGRLHWLSRPKKYSWASSLVSFDLATEQFKELPKPYGCGSSLGSCFHHLTVLRGCLSVGTYHDKQLEVWVMKEYGSKESWIKEFNIGTYLPKTLQLESSKRLKLGLCSSYVRVLCILKSGEVLLDYKGRALLLYHPSQGTLKEFTFPEMPNWFKIIFHVGSFNWLDTHVK